MNRELPDVQAGFRKGRDQIANIRWIIEKARDFQTQDIETIFEIFSKTCQCLKRQIYETNFEVETANTDMEDNYMNMKNVVIDSSYRLVNERIMKCFRRDSTKIAMISEH